MATHVIPFLRKAPASFDWTQAELAEFFRVEATLLAAGMRAEVDRGRSDEGDPWFVFCHGDGDQEVIIHFARLGDCYVVSAPSLGGVETHHDFRQLIRRLLDQYEAIAEHRRAGGDGQKGNVILHPAAMLWVLVALAFMKSSEAQAFEEGPDAPRTPPVAETSREVKAEPILIEMVGYAVQAMAVALISSSDALAEPVPSADAPPTLSWLAIDVVQPDVPNHVSPVNLHISWSTDSPYPTESVERPVHVWVGSAINSKGALDTPVSAPIASAVALHTQPVEHQDATEGGSPQILAQFIAAPIAAEAAILPGPTEAQLVLDLALGHNSSEIKTASAIPTEVSIALDHAIHVTDAATVGLAVTQTNDAEVKVVVHDVPSEEASPAPDSIVPIPAATTSSPIEPHPAVQPTLTTATADIGGTHTQPAAPQEPVGHPAPQIAPQSAPATSAAPIAALFQEPASDAARLALARTAIQEFLKEVPQAVQFSDRGTGNQVIYDPLAANIDLKHLQAVTFDLADGSHVSLVGLPSELTYALAGHNH